MAYVLVHHDRKLFHRSGSYDESCLEISNEASPNKEKVIMNIYANSNMALQEILIGVCNDLHDWIYI